jgi:metallophosphoesterase superfamily enzyme
MQKLTILNDHHLGVIRSAGTTPLTAFQLRQYVNECFAAEVEKAEGPLCFLGDLFDTGHIPMADLLRAWQVLREHCRKGRALIMVQGNHDLEKTLTTLSSFQFLCQLLVGEFGGLVTVVDRPTLLTEWDAYVVPHLPNQDLFDAALAEVPACSFLLVHCNYHNNFAVESDHSLNLSMDQARALPVKHIIFAHEHQQKTALGGKVVVVGNQFPSSVSDCLGNDSKRCAVLQGGGITFRETWNAAGEYEEQAWNALIETKAKFVRVTGEASAEEAADVVSAIAKFRNKSKALVITNAVKVAGAADAAQIQMTMEEVKAFDVLAAVLECLDPREQEVVKSLLNVGERSRAEA